MTRAIPTIRTAEQVGAAARVEVQEITKSFDGTTPVLSGIDIAVEPGESLALLGPSGCGKTTLLRIIAGLDMPDAGTVAVADRTLTGPSSMVAPEHRHIGMVFQDWALFPHLSVARNVGFGLPRPERKVSPRIDEALELVGLSGLGDRMPSTLSGGQQQRVALARAIAPRPNVLLLDEPFSNLDASLRVQVRTEIHQLLVELGVTTIFVTHDQDEAFVLGDRVAVLDGGRIVQVGAPAELYLRPVSRWMAQFVGDANLVPGTADAMVVDTALGRVPLIESATGPVDVLIRPEQLSIELVDTTAPTRASAERSAEAAVGEAVWEAEVGLVEFVGHDTTYFVRGGDTSVQVRRPSMPVAARGDRVRVRYSGGPAQTFPRSS